MRKSLLRIFAVAVVVALAGTASALALRLEVGNVVVVTDEEGREESAEVRAEVR